MSHIYINYSRWKFNEWKRRVAKHLPLFVIKFYSANRYIDYEMNVLLGRVIADINNPFYGHTENGKLVNYTSEFSARIVLEIQVNKLFSFISKL